MNLSKETLAVIRNFSAINGSLMIQEGSRLATISEGRTIMCEATITESFPQNFGIYDLNEFLSAMGLFETANLDFSDKSVSITDGGRSKIKYFAAGEGIVKPAPDTIKFPDADINFDLDAGTLGMILKTSSALKAADVAIIGDGSTLSLRVTDKKNDTSNAFELSLGDTDQEFKANLKVENLKLLPGDYEVSISSKKISRFVNKTASVTYYIAVEADSEF